MNMSAASQHVHVHEGTAGQGELVYHQSWFSRPDSCLLCVLLFLFVRIGPFDLFNFTGPLVFLTFAVTPFLLKGIGSRYKALIVTILG